MGFFSVIKQYNIIKSIKYQNVMSYINILIKLFMKKRSWPLYPVKKLVTDHLTIMLKKRKSSSKTTKATAA